MLHKVLLQKICRTRVMMRIIGHYKKMLVRLFQDQISEVMIGVKLAEVDKTDKQRDSRNKKPNQMKS